MSSAFLAGAMLLGGCSADADGTSSDTETTGDDSDDGMEGGMSQTVTLEFRAAVNGADFACGDVSGIGLTGETVQLDGLRMFISDLKLAGADGELVDAPIIADDTWAQERVGLLDFEESCGDAGSAGTNASVEVTVPTGEYTGIQFQLGLPFDLNHSDASSPDAAAPLNNAAMFWNWQGGYKFLRLDMKTGADAATAWNVHLGSTMCMSDTAVTPPTTECGRPNLPTITLDDFNPTTQTIVFDVGVLLEGTDVTMDAMGTPPGCFAMPPDEAECTDIFSRLGMDFATGACADNCAGQQAFSVE
ncbi:MAG: MbnP family copper-binding protein [Nannocystaceae bacterium]